MLFILLRIWLAGSLSLFPVILCSNCEIDFGILCDSSICGNSYSDICLYRWQSYYDLFSYNVENTYSYMPLSFALNPRRKGPLRTLSQNPHMISMSRRARLKTKVICQMSRTRNAMHMAPRRLSLLNTYIKWRYLPYRARAECVPAGECYNPTIQGTTCN